VKPHATRKLALYGLILMLMCAGFECSRAQGQVYERKFPQSKATIESELKDLQAALAGRLPTLEGFAMPGDHPLDRYARGYFQSTVQVIPIASGGSVVRVSTKVTAWYTDSAPSRSGYQLLTSNGRIETDFLDQLSEQLAAGAPAQSGPPKQGESAPVTAEAHKPAQPMLSAPVPRFPDNSGEYSSSLSQSLSAKEMGTASARKNANGDESDLQQEAESLQQVLQHQAHPKNLVAVKNSGTPVVATPSLKAKTLFLASAHDEFEMLDFNSDWVHVRISGLSRGWIWRDSLEMPDSIPDNATKKAQAAAPTAAQLFHVVREETAPFPGDWDALRDKTVKIVSVQKNDDQEKGAGAQMKLEFAKAVFDKYYSDLAGKPQGVGGVVVIFDSADGGMIAASMPVLEQWRAGTLSDAALWHQCFFDPPETFDSTGTSASR